MAPKMGPKRIGTFEKQVPGARFSKVPKTFRARKVPGTFERRAPGPNSSGPRNRSTKK